MKKITSFFASTKKKRLSSGADGVAATKESSASKRIKADSASSSDLWEHLEEISWRTILTKKQYSNLASFVEKERKSHTIYPSKKDTFSALNSMKRDDVRVVIVGQDPYHQPGQAHGLSFSVRPGVKAPPSLVNIYKELKEDSKIENFTTIPGHGHLQRWADQGVLLLNTVLTVRQGEANSHKRKGWEEVTDAILAACPSKVVFLLWGKPAHAKAERFSKPGSVVITTSHPSPLGATKTDKPFTGSRCFSRCNDALIKMGQEPIDWRVDES